MSGRRFIAGVEYTPEAVMQAHAEVAALRNEALVQTEFHAATLLSHVLAYLYDYQELLVEVEKGKKAETELRALIEELLGLAGAWEHQDRYFPSGPQYAVDLRAKVGAHISEENS